MHVSSLCGEEESEDEDGIRRKSRVWWVCARAVVCRRSEEHHGPEG